jgi:hypothetical protein
MRNGLQNKKRGMLVCSVVLHDNVGPHSAVGIDSFALMRISNWVLFDQPSYSPELAPSRCCLFAYLVGTTALQQQWGVDGRCRNVHEQTDRAALFITGIPEFQQRLRGDAAQVHTYFLYSYKTSFFLGACFVGSWPKVTSLIALVL